MILKSHLLSPLILCELFMPTMVMKVLDKALLVDFSFLYNSNYAKISGS